MRHTFRVALRKESVDRNVHGLSHADDRGVALRKESVDRNRPERLCYLAERIVALRKESVDRNVRLIVPELTVMLVALRKESVDRNDPSAHELQRVTGRSPQGERG